MLRPPEACRESMERARRLRGQFDAVDPWADAEYAESRRETREVVRTLRAARRSEGALAERWGIA